MKKIVSVLLLCSALAAPVWAKDKPRLVASNYSDRYHVSTCKIAAKIGPDELVEFKTPEEAQAAGYVPCKKCNPPASSNPPKD